jgi:hypothetical protein
MAIKSCNESTSQNNASSILVHRFKENVHNYDVIVDPNDSEFIIPPKEVDILTPDREIVGVSFFLPVHDMFTTAQIKISNFIEGEKKHCFLTDANNLPTGLGCKQDKLLQFRADKEDDDKYPLSFRSLSNNKKKDRLDHAYHYSIYPEYRMKRSDFDELINNLTGPICELKGGSGSGNGSGLPSIACDWDLPRTSAPSSQRMRFICEALQSFVKTTDSANDALLAYALYHHIGTEDVSFEYFERDSSFSRLIFRAVQCFASPAYLGPVAETAYADIMDDLLKFCPTIP